MLYLFIFFRLSVALALGLEAGGEDQHDHEQNYQAETNDGMTSNSLDPLASIIQANHNGLQLQVYFNFKMFILKMF